MAKTNKVLIGVDGQITELTGAELEAFETDRAQTLAAELLLETEYKAKQDARASAITKLGEIAGLTKEELDAIL